MPPEYVAARRSAASVSPKRASSSSTRARASRAGRCARSAIRRRFSRPVSSSSIAENCPVTPMERRTPSGSVRTSNPATRASPSSALMSVDRMRIMVVLPAPLGPSRA